jgi:Ca2+-transporting ATPase
VAREASDLVLLDDSFASIVGGIRLGRRIFTNLRRALTYVAGIHVPIAGVALGPLLLGLPPMLFPMHVVLLELVIDPTCALVFEAEPSNKQAMKQPPRRADEALFGPLDGLAALAQGAGLLVGVLCLYAWALSQAPEAEARAAAFIGLIAGNLALALVDSFSSGQLFAAHRRSYWTIVFGVTAALALIVSVPALGELFSLSAPGGTLLLGALAVTAVSSAWAALLRLLGRRARAPRRARLAVLAPSS